MISRSGDRVPPISGEVGATTSGASDSSGEVLLGNASPDRVGRRPRLTQHQRLDAHTDKSGECWLWTGTKDRDGYGLMWTPEGTRGAHRVAYTLSGREIPAGLQIDHICRVTSCVRPDHLQVVTPQQNAENRKVPHASVSGVRGVVRAGKRWEARVKHSGKSHRRGPFDSIDEAASAARELRMALHTNNLHDREAS